VLVLFTLFQAKKNQLESWFISAFQQMWWARQESNLRPEGISFVATLYQLGYPATFQE